MKRYIALILAIIMTLCLCAGCGDSKNDPGFDAVEASVKAAADNDEILMDIPDSYMEGMMKLSPDSYTDRYARISKVGTNIDEFGLFKTDDPDALKSALESYLQYREEIWMDEYLPEEHPKLQNAEVWSVGSYVMYAILGDDAMGSAEIAFKGCFEG